MKWQNEDDRTLRGKIVNTLGHLWEAIYNGTSPATRDFFDKLGIGVASHVDKGAAEATDPVLRFVEQFSGLPPDVLRPMMTTLNLPAMPWWAKAAGIVGIIAGGLVSGLLVGPMRLFQMQVQKTVRSALPSMMQVALAKAKGKTYNVDYQDTLEKMGLPDGWITAILDQGITWPSVGYIQELLNRGEITETDADTWIRMQGFSAASAKELLKLRMEIPNIQDLIRFAVREAFSPELAEKLGLYQEFPTALMADAAKRGLSEHYARMFWAAHWQLPSVSQAFEMLHRRSLKTNGTPFVEEDMRDLLKVQDYSPVWRDLLIQIAFRPFTRRELPRLFRLGVINQEQMKSSYMDLGLSPERAQILVDASIREAREASRDLSRADIEAGYKRRLLSPEAAAAALASMGFDEDEVAYILARVDYDKAQARVSSRKTTIKRRYVARTIDHVEATRQLADAGVEAEEITDLLVDWTEEREAKVERPTVDQLSVMYRRRLLTGPEMTAEIAGHGYGDRYVQLLIANIEADIAEDNARTSEAEKRRAARMIKLPTKADLLDWLQSGIITQDVLRQRMRDQGYLDEDIDRYLAEEGIVVVVPAYKTEEGRVRVATLKLAYRAGNITASELVTGLIDLDMPPSLADAIAEYETVRLPASP